MKIFVTIFLLCIYSLSSLGIGIKEFYCCGKLESVSVSLTNTQKEKCSKDDNKEGCCKTKYQYFKVKDNHLLTAHVAAPQNLSTDLPIIPPLSYSVSVVIHEADVINGNHAPPSCRGIPVYISNCVFRI